ncbi:MAG: hypothetical protein JOZ41_02620, partial [Chloroflexi bacterium]|nr:hypothetical protein [Chloroflexota bacterium]
MVRTLPAAILAALQTPQNQQPYFSVTLQDTQRRWTTVTSSRPATNGRSHAILTQAATILQLTTAVAGSLYFNRVLSPYGASQWTTAWSLITTSTTVASAGCYVLQIASGTIYAFYQRSSDNRICYVTSSNDGQSWSAEATLPAAPLGIGNLCYGICAANPSGSTINLWAIYASYQNAPSSLYRSQWAGASWSAWASEGPSSPANWGQLRGLSCLYGGGNTLIFAGIQRVAGLTGISAAETIWNGASYSPWNFVQSLDNQSMGLSCQNPHSWWAGSGTEYLTIAIADNGSISGTAQQRVVIFTSPDGTTWTPWAELGNPISQEVNVLAVSGAVYVFDNVTVLSTLAGPAQTDVSNDVLALHISDRPNDFSRLTLTLANLNGAYNNHPSVRPDAQIQVSFGYGSTLLPTHSFILDLYTYQAAADLNELTIQARSCDKLLDYPQQRFLANQSQTISWLASFIARMAGVQLATLPGTPQFSQTVPCFVISPGETWHTALKRVGAIYGFDFFADSTPQLRVVERSPSDPSSWSYASELLAAEYGQSADQANMLRVVGQTSTAPATTVFADTYDPTNLQQEGRERFRNIVDRQLDTAAK